MKRHQGEKFTADELQKYLNLGAGLYENLKRLRKKCRNCSSVIENVPSNCPWCNFVLDWEAGVVCVKAPHRKDSRRHSYFYWWYE